MSEQSVKRKNSEKRRMRQFARLGIALVCIPLAVALLLFSMAIGWLHGKQRMSAPEDKLVHEPYAGTPAYTVLQELAVRQPSGTLYLVAWHRPDTSACIGLIWIAAPHSLADSASVGRANADCYRASFTIDQFWGMRTWQRIPFSVAYGFSRDAAEVVVTWQDDLLTAIQPIHGSYLAINPAKSRVIKAVDFYDASGLLLFRFPDSAKSPRAES